jgi:hypothetical protein
MRKTVVLPQPEGPSRLKRSPTAISNESDCTASTPLSKVLETWFKAAILGMEFVSLCFQQAAISRSSLVEVCVAMV